MALDGTIEMKLITKLGFFVANVALFAFIFWTDNVIQGLIAYLLSVWTFKMTFWSE